MYVGTVYTYIIMFGFIQKFSELGKYKDLWRKRAYTLAW